MPDFISTTDFAKFLSISRSQATRLAGQLPSSVKIGKVLVVAANGALAYIQRELAQAEADRAQFRLALRQLDDPDAEETYTAADLGRLLGITRQGATLLVQREFAAEADGGNYAIPLADVRAYIERKIAQHEARIAHLQGSLAKLQETAPAAPQELPTAE